MFSIPFNDLESAKALLQCRDYLLNPFSPIHGRLEPCENVQVSFSSKPSVFGYRPLNAHLCIKIVRNENALQFFLEVCSLAVHTLSIVWTGHSSPFYNF